MAGPGPTPRAGLLARLSIGLQRHWWATPRTITAQLLRLPAGLYAALAALHRGLSRPHRLDVPVLVVGNRLVGGAGKTPTTLALVGLLRREGWRPGVVSRGHGRLSRGLVDVERHTPASQAGDEPLLLRLRGDVPVCVGLPENP